MSTNYIGPEKILEKKKEYLVPCSYHFYSQPPQMVRGEMQYLYDSEGTQYLDFFAGVSVMNCGHCNPEILDKTIAQMKTLQHTTTIYLTQPIVDLAEKLAGVMPGDLKRTFFCGTGSEANEGALLLARLYTGKSEFLSMYNGLHGRTHLTMAVTGLGMWRTDPNPAAGISFVPNPYCYRCPYKADDGQCGMECVAQVENVIKKTTSGRVAAMIAEPIQGNGGMITPPKGYFKALKEVLNKYEILLIIDEVQTGFGRTGKMFAIEHYDIQPDIMTMAKALGNGMPIAAYSTSDTIAAAFTRPSASTLGGNPVSAATGIAVLDYIENKNLCERARVLGDKLRQGLMEIKENHRIVGDVRGMGLMQGVELVKEKKEPAVKETDMILEALKEKGILIGKNGADRNVLAFQPPLIITEEDVDRMLCELNNILNKWDNK
ncbi:aspartate aminotransferase family protein [Petroclostridium sp. X23]|uniref:aspartate aminotransferase family protein n=1 Tax=Petroclostridium sp. X23 TaxID=3045146 RepID=UPI0024ACAF6D|nr:aspartate aminotransferase family protein [Petroclostridium sp. X23]WHH61187.1 aspartate aminotransferase family protein [Petroclostridium sp. X23]